MSPSEHDRGRPQVAPVREPWRSGAARRLRPVALVAGGLLLGASTAVAQTWRIDPAIELRETVTNNVDLEATEDRQGDFVTRITPSLRITGKSAHTKLDGFISVPILLYARTGSENNEVYPFVDLRGNAELVERLFYIDGIVSVSQQFFSPLGAQPGSLESSTQNRYQSANYGVSPYLKGVAFGDVAYELRNANSWNTLSGAPISTENSHTTQWTGKASNKEARLGWEANFDITDVRFEDQGTIKTRLVRIVPLYRINPQLLAGGSVGYEDNEYLLTESNGMIYGVGFDWRPTPRTQVIGKWEHRFFGSSYLYSFDHRTPLSVWNVRVSRNITTYPQQIASLPAGIALPGLLDNLFLSTIPDQAERTRAVDQFLQNRGLPTTLSSPVNLYSQQIQLQQSQSATVGLLGARNTLFFTVYNLDTNPISAAGEDLPPVFTFGNDIRQSGVNVVWTHNLTSLMVLNVTGGGYRSVSRGLVEVKTNQGGASVELSAPLSRKTKAFAGARFQSLSANVGTSYNEVAAFIGISHSFR